MGNEQSQWGGELGLKSIFVAGSSVDLFARKRVESRVSHNYLLLFAWVENSVDIFRWIFVS